MRYGSRPPELKDNQLPKCTKITRVNRAVPESWTIDEESGEGEGRREGSNGSPEGDPE